MTEKELMNKIASENDKLNPLPERTTETDKEWEDRITHEGLLRMGFSVGAKIGYSLCAEEKDKEIERLEARIRELEEGLRDIEISLPQKESYLDDDDTRDFYWRVIVECREHINKLLSGSGSGGYNGIKPKIICYCGSLRVAMDAFKKAEYEAVLKGEIALLPCCMFVDIEREYGAESDYKQKADALHKWKIDISDEVFILNVNGYIGQSTRSELEYALSIGKPVKYLEPLPQPPKQ